MASNREEKVGLHELTEDEHRDCVAFADILDRIANKWAMMIVAALVEGPMRFNALQRSVKGVSHRMLTLTLRGLQRDGLISRQAYPTSPPKVEYELTTRGRSLFTPLRAVMHWVQENREGIEASRAEADLAVD